MKNGTLKILEEILLDDMKGSAKDAMNADDYDEHVRLDGISDGLKVALYEIRQLDKKITKEGENQ